MDTTTEVVLYEEAQALNVLNPAPFHCLGCGDGLQDGTYPYCELCDPGLANEAKEVREYL